MPMMVIGVSGRREFENGMISCHAFELAVVRNSNHERVCVF